MRKQLPWIAVIAVAYAFLAPSPARAGKGDVVGNKVNLSIMFTYRESDADAWKPLFDEASRLLFNATNGQLQLGVVRVDNCSFQKKDADVWIQDNNAGAISSELGLGGTGHIYLSQTHKNTTGPAFGQFGLVHEFGHYGLGLYDEYKPAPPPPMFAKLGEQVEPPIPGYFCVAEHDSIACIMDGGSLISPNNRRTEFCTDALGGLRTRHVRGNGEGDSLGGVNAQQALNSESCWQTIARRMGFAPPAAVQTEDPPGLVPIEWQVVPGLTRLVICIDRSASMYAQPDKIDLAKEAAAQLVQLLHGRTTMNLDGAEITLPGEHLGIISFASDDSVEFPMREITAQSTKDSAGTAVETISRAPTTNSQTTNLGGGLQASVNEILAEGQIAACSEAVVLLSDGSTNAGGDPRDLIQQMKERGIRVYSVGLGDNANVDLMKAIADSTDGRFFHAVASRDLPDIATSIAAEVRSAGVLGSVQDSVAGQDEHLPFHIDEYAEEVTSVLQWNTGTLDLVLTSPSGDVIDLGSGGRDDVETGRQGDLLYIRVLHPEQGEWDARVSAGNQTDPIRFGLTFLDENQQITVGASTDREVYDYPTPMHLRVDVVSRVPVAGAEVTAVVDRPNDGPVTIPLFDDGLPQHGDRWANDGVYNTIFDAFTTNSGEEPNFSADGDYTFNVHVVNVNGTGPDPSLPFVEDGSVPESIPPFVRDAQVSASVRGMAGPIQGKLTFERSALQARDLATGINCTIDLPKPYRGRDIDLTTLRLNGLAVHPSQVTRVGDSSGEDERLTVRLDPGSAIGAIVTTLILLPFLGFINSCLVMVMLNIFSAGFLYLRQKKV